MDRLPAEILELIFFVLPNAPFGPPATRCMEARESALNRHITVFSVVQCFRVCRLWRDILSWFTPYHPLVNHLHWINAYALLPQSGEVWFLNKRPFPVDKACR